jgi:hypothetical protein
MTELLDLDAIRARFLNEDFDEKEFEMTGASAGFRLDPEVLIDLAVDYQAMPRIELTPGTNNALDTQPDAFELSPTSSAFYQIHPYSHYTPYGTNGRLIYLRVNAAFE